MWGVMALVGTVLAFGVGQPREVREEAATIISGGKEIGLQLYLPDGAEKCPAVVFLHGADGLKLEPLAPYYRNQARGYAKHGFLVVLPHYMDRTDNGKVTLVEILKQYPVWFDTAKDTLDFTAKHPRVDPSRLALMGVSLGGTMGIDLAAKDRRVKAFIDYFGGFPAPFAPGLKRMPPTLILHGARDRLVSPRDAERLDRRLTELHVEHELVIYATAGHGFFGADQRDSIERGVRFLEKYLPEP